MNRTRTIAIFAGIFAIAMTTYGLSGISASPMAIASIPQASEGVQWLGHVEYTVLDSNQKVKAYLQSDNFVVESGTDCAGTILFGVTSDTECGVTTPFQYIAIGNATSGTAATTDLELAFETTSTCAATGDNNGEQARKLVVPTVVLNATGNGGATQIELDVGLDTFKFDALNATIVAQSGLFNAQVNTVAPDGSCQTLGVEGTDWEMFAIQDLSGGGVTVAAGDSLAVKWTITIAGTP